MAGWVLAQIARGMDMVITRIEFTRDFDGDAPPDYAFGSSSTTAEYVVGAGLILGQMACRNGVCTHQYTEA